MHATTIAVVERKEKRAKRDDYIHKFIDRFTTQPSIGKAKSSTAAYACTRTRFIRMDECGFKLKRDQRNISE